MIIYRCEHCETDSREPLKIAALLATLPANSTIGRWHICNNCIDELKRFFGEKS